MKELSPARLEKVHVQLMFSDATNDDINEWIEVCNLLLEMCALVVYVIVWLHYSVLIAQIMLSHAVTSFTCTITVIPHSANNYAITCIVYLNL